MLTCENCGKRVKIISSIKSRVRKEPYEYDCSCGYVFYISKEDVEENTRIRMARLDERRNHKHE